jgi:response regulator RpfG family c-di-GMP phosphodiesterase
VEFVGTLYQAGDRKLIHCSIRDVTVRIHSEKTLATQARALRLLSRCSSLLMHADEEHLLLDGICRLAVETGGYMMAWVGFAEHDAAKTVRPVAYSGYEQGYLDTLRISWADTELGHGPSGIAIRTGRTAINQNCLTDPKMWPWHAAMIKRGYQSFIALPLTRSGKTYGALAIYSADPFAFVKEEVDLLEELVKELSFGINTLRARIENEQKATILKQSLEQSIKAIANTFESRETSTVGHQRRVADLARAIACEMCLPEEQVIGLHLAATIHDSGKIEVPTEILSKTGKLTESEFMLIKTHAQAGYDILKGVQFPWPVADIILQHHERLDGSGYPQGLKEEQILLEAKIIAVADVVEAISTDRSYLPSLGIEAALEEVERYRGVRYDPKAVDACLRLFRELGYTLPA